MMPFHLSILITPAENGDSKRWGWKKKVTEEKTGRIMGIALSRDSALHPKCG